MRNSINLKIFQKLKKRAKKVDAYDPFISSLSKVKYNTLKEIKLNNNYDIIVFLSSNKRSIYNTTLIST